MVMVKAGGSQLLNTTTGQILALPGNTQTMMINKFMVLGKARGSRLLNTTGADTRPARQHADHDDS